ncbi:uncharacterized protein UDID_18999 [Ustilago sp. UG-2017a]|nr:uncharacterized protein UDID_18999 [Ustilago sp. UG-2017a]
MMGEGCLKAVPVRDLDIYDAEVIVGSQQGATRLTASAIVRLNGIRKGSRSYHTFAQWLGASGAVTVLLDRQVERIRMIKLSLQEALSFSLPPPTSSDHERRADQIPSIGSLAGH